MAFYNSDPKMNAQLKGLLDRLESEGRPGLKNSIAISWISYGTSDPAPYSGYGASWSEERPLYPASVVKLFYAVAAEAWIQRDLLPEGEELRRALKDMISASNNDATGFVVDMLTGTTSGPSLHGERWHAWQKQRQLVNEWLHALKWSELNSVNCCQKTWSDGPYGRESDFYGSGKNNRNLLSTAATARMLEAIMTNSVVSPPACKRLKEVLSRSLDLTQRKNDPENQVDGFLGEGLPQGTRLWSKAGLMSQARHDAAWWAAPGGNPILLVVFTHGRQRANDISLLPAIARAINNLHLGEK